MNTTDMERLIGERPGNFTHLTVLVGGVPVTGRLCRSRPLAVAHALAWATHLGCGDFSVEGDVVRARREDSTASVTLAAFAAFDRQTEASAAARVDDAEAPHLPDAMADALAAEMGIELAYYRGARPPIEQVRESARHRWELPWEFGLTEAEEERWGAVYRSLAPPT